MTQIAAERYTGASIKRSEDPRILTGRGRYIADLKLPGMLHAAFVRSPLAHGRVLTVDASAARDLPGVVLIVCTVSSLSALALALFVRVVARVAGSYGLLLDESAPVTAGVNIRAAKESARRRRFSINQFSHFLLPTSREVSTIRRERRASRRCRGPHLSR